MSILFAKNNSLSAVTALPATVSGGGLNLISTQTASSSATIDFTSGIDSTYKSYIFKFYDIHPATNNQEFTFQGSTDSGSSYGVTMTSTFYQAYHAENGSATSLAYNTLKDLAQSTSFQAIADTTGNGNDETASGFLQLFDPSSSVFVKHFISVDNHYYNGTYSINDYASGYFNTQSPIDAIQFKMASGSIESGVIKMYGVT